MVGAISIKIEVALADHIFNHSFKSHSSSIIRGIYSCNSIIVKFFYFLRQDCAAATTKYFNMTTPVFIQEVFHVFEEFNMTTLVGSDGNTLHIFFNCAFNNFSYAPVVTKVNDFSTFALKDPAHDIDCCIMPVEK